MANPAFLNYHHLRYFHAVAQDMNLTRAAERLSISQSALSVQLRKLEDSLGHPLFDRTNRRMVLTEAGRQAMDYADMIFRMGTELMDAMENRAAGKRHILRVASVGTLSRNFQTTFLRPVAGRGDVRLVLRSGSLRDLLAQLDAHTVDIVLSNMSVPADTTTGFHSHLLDKQPVSLVCRADLLPRRFRFPHSLKEIPLLLPTQESNIRTAFDALLAGAQIRPIVAAESDDMAMLRLLTREGLGVALVPRVVVQDELSEGILVEKHRLAEIQEHFYAITPEREFPNPVVRELITHARLPMGKRQRS